MPGSGGVPNGPSSPADMGGGGSAGAGGEALGGGGQGGESAGAPPLDCGPSDTYLAQMCEASAPLLQEGTRCDAYDLNYCFECTNDADCDGVPCSDGVCSSPCSDHSECGDYGICEAPGYCRGIPFCLPLMPPAMSGSYADMPLGEPLVYRSSDLPVWCENGAAAEPGFPVDVEVQLEIRAGGNVLAFPSPPSIYLSVDDGLEDVILGVELVVRWTMDFREDRYESLSYRCAMQSGDCEETSDQEGPLPKLLGDSMIRAGDSGPQELRIRFDQTGDRVLVRYFAVYVESNGKRAYLTKPPAGQVGDPCESPMCPMFLAAEYWDAQ